MKIEIYVVSQVPPALTLNEFSQDQVDTVLKVAMNGTDRFLKVWDDQQTTAVNINNVTMIRVTPD